MLKRFLATVLMVAGASAYASVTTSVDLVDPTDTWVNVSGVTLPVTQPPAGVTCIDVFIDTINANGSAWTAAGLRGVVTAAGQAAGVTIRYASGDPNTPRAEELFDPGTNNRFVTFLTKPQRRDAAGRYNNGGAGIAGGYNPTAPVETATSTEINAAWFASPPETASSPGVDGYIARVALNTAGISLELGAGTDVPQGATVIFESVGFDSGVAGTVSAAFDQPTPSGINWFVWYIPEPASLALLGLGALAFIRRR